MHERRVTTRVHHHHAGDQAGGATVAEWPLPALVAYLFEGREEDEVRALLARGEGEAHGAHITWEPVDVSADELTRIQGEFPRMREVRLRGGDGNQISLTREENIATFRHSGQQDRRLPLVRRPLGDELAEELRRLTSAPIYARALAAATGVADMDQRPAKRVHIWRDPAAVAHANQ